MIIPTIHLNGTSKKTLLEDLQNAHEKIREAMSALAYTAPHERDYYVKKDAQFAYAQAREEHGYRVTMLRKILSELEQLADGIQSQGRKP